MLHMQRRMQRGKISYVEQFRYLGSISLQDVSMQAELEVSCR